MIFDKEKYRTISKNIRQYASSHISKEEMDKFDSHIQKKLINFKPTLMVYGTYNAGKSTLLNALFGSEKAVTGDAPETAEVHPYEYNGYTIYDTPGINAPIKHEEITLEHLNKTEMVLFVVSNDGSLEEAYVYERISEIVKNNKPILLVLNNKRGTDPASSEARDEINKVNINLSKVGDQKGIDKIEEKISICMVDAKTAFEGRIENELELIQESNILNLEKEINTLLGKASTKEVVNALNQYINNFSLSILSKIDSKIKNPEQKKTEELITYFEKIKQKITAELKNLIDEQSAIVTQRLVDLYLHEDKNNIQNYIDGILKNLEQRINSKFSQLREEIKQRIQNFSNEMQEVSLQPISVGTATVEGNASQVGVSNSETSSSSAVIANATTTMIAVIPPVHPIVPILKTVAIAAIQIFQAFSNSGSNEEKDRAEAKVEQHRAHHLAAKNRAKEFGYTFKNNLNDSIERSVNELFNPLINDYMVLSKSLSNTLDQLSLEKKKLQAIINDLEVI